MFFSLELSARHAPFIANSSAYSLLLLAQDPKGNNYVGIFSYEQLVEGEPLSIRKKDCHYTLKTWHEITSIWKDLAAPENTGCYQLTVPLDVRTCKKSIILIIEKHTKNPLTTLVGSLILTDNLCYKDAFLIPNDVITEFNLAVTHLEKTDNHVLNFADLTAFADKIDSELPEPSLVRTVVQKTTGKAILAYLVIRDYLQKSWNNLSNYCKNKYALSKQ